MYNSLEALANDLIVLEGHVRNPAIRNELITNVRNEVVEVLAVVEEGNIWKTICKGTRNDHELVQIGIKRDKHVGDKVLYVGTAC